MASGFVRVAAVGHVDIRVHWVAPIVWFVGGLALGRGGLDFGGVVATMLVFGLHALGHWGMAAVHRLKVHRIELDGVGASIGYSGRATRAVHARVAFGGVITHALVGTLIALVPARGDFLDQVIWVNMVLGAINLIPLGRLDGHAGWRHLSAALRQPMPVPDLDDDHPAARAHTLAADIDRELGHPPMARPPAHDEPELDFHAGDPSVHDIVRQVDDLMAEARADARQRRQPTPDDPTE